MDCNFDHRFKQLYKADKKYIQQIQHSQEKIKYQSWKFNNLM